jgi:hypothetical protein
VCDALNAFLRAIRDIWYRQAYKAKSLSLMTPVVAQQETSNATETSIRWIPSVKISGVSRQALLFYSPGRVSFRCRVPRRGRFQTFVTCFSDAADPRRGSIKFAVEIATTGICSTAVYRKKVSLERKLSDRNWQEVNMRLNRFAEQEVDLTLATSISPNCSVDHFWALWGEPILLDCKPGEEIWADVKNFFGAFGLLGFAIEGMKLLFGQVVRERECADVAPSGRPFVIRSKTGNDLVMGKNTRPADLSYEPRKFAVYVNSRGNYFFHEIGDLLCAGFNAIGCHVDLKNEKDGFANDVDWHVVVAPHEFFYLGAGIKLQQLGLPHSLIVLNTEQPSTQWFSKAYRIFPSAYAIWDINLAVCELIRSKGFDCSYLALGYIPEFAPFAEIRELPRHNGTSSLAPEVLQQSYLNAPLAERPIDVLFIGYLSPRRAKFFTEAAAIFADYRCHFHFSDATAPALPGQNTSMNTMTAIGLAQRAKIVLNIHHGDDSYFEWHRIVMHGLWQKTLVVSEVADIAPPFEAGRDFVATCLEDLPKQITFYLSSVEGRNQAQAIVDRGFKTLRDECRLTECLRKLVDQLPIQYAPSAYTVL